MDVNAKRLQRLLTGIVFSFAQHDSDTGEPKAHQDKIAMQDAVDLLKEVEEKIKSDSDRDCLAAALLEDLDVLKLSISNERAMGIAQGLMNRGWRR
jgi:hypothetical protein